MGGFGEPSMRGERDVAALTKPALPIQASGKCLAAAVLAIVLSACGDHAAEGKDCPAVLRDHTVSGFCVPRWVSLKRGEVYGRKGAGKDYPALYVYRVKGLPVQVVAETTDWRRICDPDGGATWVHRSMIDGHRNIMATGANPIPLRKEPRENAAATAFLNARALASLDACKVGWCKVSVGGASGWMPAAQAWGVAEAKQCR
jgi:SH3-like domain-containing protein